VDQKPLLWVGSSRDDLRAFSSEVRKEVGVDLRRVQGGDLPRDWRPMPSVGPGVIEIRVRVGGAYRVMYVAKFREGIYVLHAFQKKSQRTAGIDIQVARSRLKSVRRFRVEG
jgi:phage-related protein